MIYKNDNDNDMTYRNRPDISDDSRLSFGGKTILGHTSDNLVWDNHADKPVQPQSDELYISDTQPTQEYQEDIDDELSAKPDNQELCIPDDDISQADRALGSMAFDAVQSQYTFINLAVLLIVFLAIAVTFLLIREGERYGEDNVQLTKDTFIDGTYTASLSSRYNGNMKLDNIISKLNSATKYIYGFGVQSSSDTAINPFKPSVPGQTEETTSTSATSTTAESVSKPANISVNTGVTGSAVTMASLSVAVESDFTGVIKHTCQTLTTSFTSTMPYSYTGTTVSTTAPGESSDTSSETTTTTTTTTTEPPVTTTPEETTTTTTTTTPEVEPPEVTTTPEPQQPDVPDETNETDETNEG